MVRTVPEDGAERDLWVNRHRRPNAPELSEVVNSDLAHGLTQASVRTEQFVTIVIPETRIRSEEHTSELQSLMRISYAAFCLKKKHTNHNTDYSRHKYILLPMYNPQPGRKNHR